MASIRGNDMEEEKVNPVLVSSHSALSSLSTPIDKTASPSENEDHAVEEVSFELNDPSNPVGFPFSYLIDFHHSRLD